jgi:hypothetical protein
LPREVASRVRVVASESGGEPGVRADRQPMQANNISPSKRLDLVSCGIVIIYKKYGRKYGIYVNHI